MMSCTSSIAVIALWCAVAMRPAASLQMPAVISSNMVLQREPIAARLWGFKEPLHEKISVHLDGVEMGTAESDAEGNWIFEFEPQAASSNRSIVVSSTSGSKIVFENVAFGDVYLCSGQSNMEMAVNAMENATEEITDSAHYPNLRFYALKGMTGTADEPNTFVRSKSANYNWMVSKPNMFIPPTNKDIFAFPSATCYFFGRDLYKALGGRVPIGFVSSTWSNMPIQVFMSPDALEDPTCGGTTKANSVHVKGCSQLKASQYQRDQGREEMLQTHVWFGSIYPLLHMRLSGVLWYQGESNADDPDGYKCLFPSMIVDWRRKFELPDLEFYFVQVSTGFFPWGDTLTADNMLSPEIRQAQLSGLMLKNTVAIPSYDLGEPHLGIHTRAWPLGSLHPRRKQELGRRLALAVQKMHYGLDVLATGPVFERFGHDSNSGIWSVAFTSDTAGGLHFHGTPDCNVCCKKSPFEVRTTSGKWLETTDFEVSGNKVLFAIAAGTVGELDTVRYAHAVLPQCGLYNGAGGPDDHTGIIALPFVRAAGNASTILSMARQHQPPPQAKVVVADLATKPKLRKIEKVEVSEASDSVDISGALR